MPQLFVTGQHWALPVWVCCAQQCKVQWWPVTSSVPWGLILGPALFNVFINGEQPNLSKLGALCKHGWHSSGKGWKQHSWRSHCADQRRQKQTQHPVWDSPCTRKGWGWPSRNGIAETDMWVLLGKNLWWVSSTCLCSKEGQLHAGLQTGASRPRKVKQVWEFTSFHGMVPYTDIPEQALQNPHGKDENQAQPQGASQRETLLLPPASSWEGAEKTEPDAFCGAIIRGISQSWWTGNSNEQRKKPITTLWKSWALEQVSLNLYPQTQPSTVWTCEVI